MNAYKPEPRLYSGRPAIATALAGILISAILLVSGVYLVVGAAYDYFEAASPVSESTTSIYVLEHPPEEVYEVNHA